MAQTALIKTSKTWSKVETLMGSTFNANKTYQLECRDGASPALLQESAEAPTNDAGVRLDREGMKVVQYKKGTSTNDLYVKGDGAVVNITVIGE